MNTKLTLTIEESVIENAKKYAKGKGRSLSNLIENYLRAITKDQNATTEGELTPIVKSMKGSFTKPDSFDYKSLLSKKLSDKYLEQ